MKKKLGSILVLLGLIISCKTTTNVVQSVPVKSENTVVEPITTNHPTGLKRKVAIARFSNETLYGKGAFYTKANDPLANKATDILSSKLVQSEKFLLLENSADFGGENANKYGFNKEELIGVDYIIVGSISEFGRKDETDSKVFSRSREQTAMATVNIRLIDVKTGQVVYGEEGSGKSSTENKKSFGVGSTASYDTSINDQAISAAISKLIDNVINKLSDSSWKSYILSKEEGNYLIAGGKSQGIQVGNTFQVEQPGKRMKNPQTGGYINLPGKKIAMLQVIKVLDAPTPDNEISICTLSSGTIEQSDTTNLIILENEN
jgi:curli biogenesis system outer membrane secretion channel CsgG